MRKTAEEVAQHHHRKSTGLPRNPLTFNATEEAILAVMNYILAEQAKLRGEYNRLRYGNDE